jgi:hypothetical protein
VLSPLFSILFIRCKLDVWGKKQDFKIPILGIFIPVKQTCVLSKL